MTKKTVLLNQILLNENVLKMHMYFIYLLHIKQTAKHFYNFTISNLNANFEIKILHTFNVRVNLIYTSLKKHKLLPFILEKFQNI